MPGVAKAPGPGAAGEGPFPTELNDALGEKLREVGGEYGATTGRPRRCGWFDGVTSRHAVQINGISEADRFPTPSHGRDQVRVVLTCKQRHEVLRKRMPTETNVLALCTPVYKTFKGWKEDISKVQREPAQN